MRTQLPKPEMYVAQKPCLQLPSPCCTSGPAEQSLLGAASGLQHAVKGALSRFSKTFTLLSLSLKQ